MPFHNAITSFSGLLSRHNLTLNKAFIKVPRPATEGRGAYWKLEVGAETQIFRRMARNYNRPHTAVAKPMGLNSRGHKIFYCDTTDVNTVYIAVPTWFHEKNQNPRRRKRLFKKEEKKYVKKISDILLYSGPSVLVWISVIKRWLKKVIIIHATIT